MTAVVKAWCVLLVAAVPIAVVQAQVARSGSGGGNAETARLMQQLQQASAERLQLQAEVKRLQAELDAAKQAPATPPAAEAELRQRAKSAELSAQSSRSAANEAEAKAARLQAKLDELLPRYREATKALRDMDADRNSLQAAAKRQHGELARCVDNNAKLIELNGEVVGRLERTGFWTKLAADEPFTRLKRTELENLADANRTLAAGLAVAAPGAVPEARPIAVPQAPPESTP